MSQYILLAGDVSITLSNQNDFVNGRVDAIVDEGIRNLIMGASLFVINHEMTLTNSSQELKKRGAHLKADVGVANGLKSLGVGLCCTANNHIIDFGRDGIRDTQNALKKAGIKYIGSGLNASSVCKSQLIQVADKKVCIYNVADNEFNEVSENHFGVNVFDPFETFDEIREIKKECDYLIVVFHGGVERYRYPTPMLKKICHKMVDCGADLVTCQHSHCIGSVDMYHNAYILYGQGNFLFDDGDNEFYSTGLLLKIYPKTRVIEPISIMKEDNGVRVASASEANDIFSTLLKRSEALKSDREIQMHFNEYIYGCRDAYLNALFCNNIVFRVLNRITRNKLRNQVFSGMNGLRLINILKSEALKECLIKSVESINFE